jgi:hypothetical protein
MCKFVTKCLFVLIGILLLGVNSFGQSEKKDKPEFSVYNLAGNGKKIVYANKKDGLPKAIKARGEIVAASVSGVYCGTIATGGTVKIKLSEKIKDYNHDYLYVVVLCLAGKENENLVGENIEIEVTKLAKFPYSFGVWLSNGIDSNGTPFYLSTVEGIGGLIEQLKSKSSKKDK